MTVDTRQRILAGIGSAAFLVLAPGIVAGYLPWRITRWELQPPMLGLSPLRILGTVILALGVVGLLDSFRRFAVEGLGTPAPVLPTRTLVVSGLYRFVRNPMYVSVLAAILGQALLFGSARLLLYGAAIWPAFHLFVLAYEEPRLRATHGAEYEEFRAHVPRWIPRLTPWRGSSR